ncbi:DUF6136 family protein [Thalassotalea ganghwensis]
MISSYLVYRWQLFIYEIKHWLAQLSGMTLFLVTVLGTALPVLFYFAMVGFGMLAKRSLEPNDATLTIAGILLFQTIFLDMSKSAIKGARYKKFNASLTEKRWLMVGCDALLTLLCNPMILLNLLLLASVKVMHWSTIPHMFLFLLVQIVLTLLIFKSPLKGYLLIICCFFLSVISIIHEIEVTILIILMMTIGLYFFPSLKLNIALKKYSVWAFWLDFWRANIRVPLFVLALTAMILFIAQGFVLQRPDLSNIVFLVSGQFLVLVVCGLQVELNKIKAEHANFYHLYQTIPAFSKARDWLLVLFGLMIFSVFTFVSGKPTYAFCQFLMLLWCLWVTKRKAAYLIYNWLLSSVLMVFLSVFS